MGFYTTGERGTVKGPEEFDAEAAAKALYEGMKGLGTDENIVATTTASHTNDQRQEIKDKYKTMYGSELVEDLESELGGSFGKLVLALFQPPEDFLIDCVHRAIEGLGTDEYSLIGLLCVRTNDELNAMKELYKEKYEKDMEEDVADDLSGDLKALMIGLMNAGREESDEIDSEKVQQDAKDLFEAGSGAGTTEETFSAIFNQRSPAHMREVFTAFKEISDGKDITEHIESEFSGSLQTAYLTLIKGFCNMAELFAEKVHECVKGAGTDDDTLIQIIVSRSEIDLQDIVDAYQEKYGNSLVDDVSSDTSGDYRKLLLHLISGSPEGIANGEEAAPAEDGGEEGEPETKEEADGDEEAPAEEETEAAAEEDADAGGNEGDAEDE